MVEDVHGAVREARRRHPGLPVFVLGESMGSAVAAVALARGDAPPVDGVILSAPAVWGGEALSRSYRLALRVLAGLLPPLKVSGVQSGNWSGPVGGTRGQQPFREGLAVREAQERFEGFVPHLGRIEVECAADVGPDAMFSAWLIGFEDEPTSPVKREDTVELSCHGSPVVLKHVVEMAIDRDHRLPADVPTDD